MNARKLFGQPAKKMSEFVSNSIGFFTSFIRMMLLSSIPVAIKSKKNATTRVYRNCTVLANGPSLKDALDNNEVILNEVDVMCVNMFCKSEYFTIIKPRYYFLTDQEYFIPTTDRTKKLVEELKESFEKVDWEMYLYTCTNCKEGELLQTLTANPNIHLLVGNCSAFSSFTCIDNFMYKIRMAMPRCQTVTNFALTSAINMGYKAIYLYGADHSWTKDLRVDDENFVCYGDRHVYSKDLSLIKLDYNIAALLKAYAQMFESHYRIQYYADSVGAKIINLTKGSFVDAYPRNL